MKNGSFPVGITLALSEMQAAEGGEERAAKAHPGDPPWDQTKTSRIWRLQLGQGRCHLDDCRNQEQYAFHPLFGASAGRGTSHRKSGVGNGQRFLS